ncbi:MAG: MerC family mercury resistance protein, partial [Acidobacteriota bacterium]
MIEVELIYDDGCPNISGARTNLLRAFARADVPAKWAEWERTSPGTPERLRNIPSPTILVNGQDVAGTQWIDGRASCRLYLLADGRQSGVPPTELIAASLIRAKASQRRASGGGPRVRNLTAVPAIVAGLLPNVTCPACWPAYAGLLSALGLGFLVSSAYLFPLTAALLLVAVCTIGLRARERHRYGPFVLGFVAAATLLAGKFVLASQIMTYGGIAVLIAASLWNNWPRRLASAACPRCKPAGNSP